MTSDLAEYVLAVVQARCPELSSADLAAAFSNEASPDPDMTNIIPPEFADAIVEVLDALEQRLEQIEQGVRAA